MLTQMISYQQERKYATDRFVVLVVLMLAAFVLSGIAKGNIAQSALLSGFVLLVTVFFSIAHFYLISAFPGKLVGIRKYALLLLDISLLTYFIVVFGEDGFYLLPFFLLIIMRSGLALGASFFNVGVFFSAVAWFVLYTYSPYWHKHVDILEMFAITTLLVAIFFQRIILRLDEENMQLNQTLKEVSIDASYDELTGLANRKEHKEMLASLIKAQEPFALLFIDLNKFKAINDTYGHHVGDEVLREVARRLTAQVDDEDFIARLGGDEFVIITRRKKIYMEKFIASLERNVIGQHKVGSVVLPIELSIGVSYYPDDARTAMMVGKYADEAMYFAKKDPDRYHYFYHELTDEQKASSLK
jgi:diguanylate cyclase (GGDEF)-like protein